MLGALGGWVGRMTFLTPAEGEDKFRNMTWVAALAGPLTLFFFGLKLFFLYQQSRSQGFEFSTKAESRGGETSTMFLLALGFLGVVMVCRSTHDFLRAVRLLLLGTLGMVVAYALLIVLCRLPWRMIAEQAFFALISIAFLGLLGLWTFRCSLKRAEGE